MGLIRDRMKNFEALAEGGGHNKLRDRKKEAPPAKPVETKDTKGKKPGYKHGGVVRCRACRS